MPLEIKALRPKDVGKAIQFAITGMHFNWYLDSKLLLKLYGRYFWYMEMNRATQVIAAYADGRLAGVLLADMKGEAKKHRSFWRGLYVKVFDFLQHTFYQGGVGVYEQANRHMRAQYLQNNTPAGEIVFLAADPQIKAQGIGSRLLREFERRESGKKVYLFTDDACTYQFYEHRGFERACEEDVVLDMGGRKVPLKCLLYSKIMESQGKGAGSGSFEDAIARQSKGQDVTTSCQAGKRERPCSKTIHAPVKGRPVRGTATATPAGPITAIDGAGRRRPATVYRRGIAGHRAGPSPSGPMCRRKRSLGGKAPEHADDSPGLKHHTVRRADAVTSGA